MKTYTSFATALNKLLADDTAITLTSEGFSRSASKTLAPQPKGIDT